MRLPRRWLAIARSSSSARASRRPTRASTRAEGAYDPVVRGDTRYRDQTLPATSVLSGAPAGELAPTSRGISGSASFSQLFGSRRVADRFAPSVVRDTTNNFLTLISPAWFTSLGVELRQPLLQNRAIDPARRAIRVSRVRAIARRRRCAASSPRPAAVEQAYWTLVAASRDVEIRERASPSPMPARRRPGARRGAGGAGVGHGAVSAEIERRRGDLFASREVGAARRARCSRR